MLQARKQLKACPSKPLGDEQNRSSDGMKFGLAAKVLQMGFCLPVAESLPITGKLGFLGCDHTSLSDIRVLEINRIALGFINRSESGRT
jgi:hypothetical protein